jgi:hypothetical protein
MNQRLGFCGIAVTDLTAPEYIFINHLENRCLLILHNILTPLNGFIVLASMGDGYSNYSNRRHDVTAPRRISLLWCFRLLRVITERGSVNMRRLQSEPHDQVLNHPGDRTKMDILCCQQ